MKKYLILDCYVDEPTCLGVPPFVSPYPRYIFGALISARLDLENIVYLTIDDLRLSGHVLDEKYDMVFLIGGAVVPGRYLGSKIGTKTEIEKILSYNSNNKFTVGGLISSVINGEHPNAIMIKGDIEKFAFLHAKGIASDVRRTFDDISAWAVRGALVIRSHPHFPDIICEIETARGCPRTSHCSFCSEGLYKDIEFRNTKDILNEIDALIHAGARRFRIGRQADILQFGSDLSTYKNGFPRPNPQKVKEFFSGIRERIKNGKIDTLNVDNANPGTIVNYPSESEEIISEIAQTVTSGDTLPFGIESFDPLVVKMNSLKVSEDGAIFAVEMVNRLGGFRQGGIPTLLPGINLIHGLNGENEKTFKKNYLALKRMLDMGLLIKRINIRKIQEYPGTPIFDKSIKISRAVANRFEYYREKIRDDIDVPMLEKIYPSGTILKEVKIFDSQEPFSYGKQISSYSIAVKFPMKLELHKFYDALVISHKERSIIALPYPADINTLPLKALEKIPGIGRKTASEIVLRRPFGDTKDSIKYFQEVEEDILKKIFNQL